MAKFQCVCGSEIRTSGEIPNPLEWHLLSDVAFNALEGLVDADALYRSTTIAYRCPASGHLYIYWDGFESPPTVYEPRPDLRGYGA